MSKYINLTGETFGRLLVLHRNGSNRSGDAMFLCRCDCGTLTVVRGKHLRSGNTTSCGCYKAEQDVLRQADQIVDMSDQSFGNWYVLGRAENRKNTRQAYWECICTVCQTQRRVFSGQVLREGKYGSCGCAARNRLEGS